jgi:hypothetical protein
MTAEDLRREVCSLPGVASAEVTSQAGAPPLIRVWTDGTRSDADVQRAVERIAVGGLSSREDASRRRSGLGRSLEDTLPAAFAEPVPSHLVADVVASTVAGRFFKLTIEETAGSVEILAIDDAGREAQAVVAPGADGLTTAVASAVARLRGFPSPRRVVVNTREVDGATVVTVLVEMPSGIRSAGAAIVAGGLPFTVGRAVDSALNGLE